MRVSRDLRGWSLALGVIFLTTATGFLAKVAFERWSKPVTVFQIAPYLQPGDDPAGGPLALLWQTDVETSVWSVQVRDRAEAAWVNVESPEVRRFDLENLAPFQLYRAFLEQTHSPVRQAVGQYRVLRDQIPVFHAEFSRKRASGAAERIVVLGDCASATSEQKAIAFQVYQARPDYAVVTGDIVYTYGRVSEYLDHFFPIYNAGQASETTGAPLLRSIPFYAAPGNHDLVMGDLDLYPDALAYFYYWSQPLNGPLEGLGERGVPILRGAQAKQEAFRLAAGPAYPRMASFSFDKGPIHWTVLDSNRYVDWTDPERLDWLRQDLNGPAAQRAAWRFVVFHHPPFQSSHAHAEDQWMRRLAPLFEAAGVAVVFNGHVHNYQRSCPMEFVPDTSEALQNLETVAGQWTLDRGFDGVSNIHPRGVIYMVTGGGGARLYNPEQHDHPESWQAFTTRFVSNSHSFTVVDATDQLLTFRQLTEHGVEVDSFQIGKPPLLAPGSR